jgi:ribosomal protein S27AE
MKTFFKEIDISSKTDMIEFLKNHFRYNTMNSWNRSTSYANCLKFNSIGLASKTVSKLFDLYDCNEFYETINQIINNWNDEHNYKWQAGFNGRNNGYLVLYKGGLEPTQHKSRCTNCGQLNFLIATDDNKICGKCGQGTRINLDKPHVKAFSKPGQPTDMNEDFEDWDIDSLKSRVELVQEFDQLCDDIVEEAVYLAEHFNAETEEYQITKTRQVFVAC